MVFSIGSNLSRTNKKRISENNGGTSSDSKGFMSTLAGAILVV